MRSMIICVLIIMLTGCATTGKIIGNRFIDNIYPFEFKFPDDYTLKTVSSIDDAAWRIAGLKWAGENKSYYKPTIVIAIISAEGRSYYQFIEDTKRWHYDINVILCTSVEYEEDISVNDICPHLVYFSGGGMKGVNAYIKVDEYYMKIDYVTSFDYYDFDDIFYVLENITLQCTD